MARVATIEACRFIIDCLQAAGASHESAEQQADLLVQSAIIGQPSYGINKLEYYVNDILCGVCKPNNKPEILKETPSTAWVDANNVLGATASHFAMDLAIDKANKTGVGWVVVKSSNHNGNAGYWAQKAADSGLIGMAFTNSAPLLAPTRSKQAALGSNPIAVAAPAANGESFYLDMATTAVSLAKIQRACRNNEQIPSGWAQGCNGKETHDPEEAYNTRRLYPLGGHEVGSSYKGYGLAAMVDMFTGICSGSTFGHQVKRWTLTCDPQPADISHCFVAIDPKCFAPNFSERLEENIQFWRDLDPIHPDKPVMAPGDMEKISACVVEKTGCIHMSECLIDSCEFLALKLNVKPLEINPKPVSAPGCPASKTKPEENKCEDKTPPEATKCEINPKPISALGCLDSKSKPEENKSEDNSPSGEIKCGPTPEPVKT